MEFTKDFITEHKLTDDQMTAINAFTKDEIATLKGTWDGEANKNAENILEGAVAHFQKQNNTDIKRDQGEKYGDYIKRATSTLVEAQRTALETAKGEYDTKVKDFKGGDDLKQEIVVLKKDNDDLLKKYANFDDISEKAGKFDTNIQELTTLKLELAFNSVKPNFPDTVNEYEATAKWEIFRKDVLSKFDIIIDEGTPKAVDKTNKHRIKDLKEMLEGDAIMKALMTGRKQEGSGADTREMETYKDVPFDVPKDATTKEISKLIRDYLQKNGVESSSVNFSAKFTELNKKILGRETATA